MDVVVSQIFHLACPASPAHYQKDPVSTLRTTFLGTLNMCNLARSCGARLLLASTSEVYGDPTVHPQSEEYNGNVNPVGPRACYDEGKRVAETLCTEFARQHNVEVRIARIFNTYGPGMAFEDGRVVSNFITEALQNQPLTIYGTGNQTRSFCYVSDLVDGLIKLMDSEYSCPINLGNPTEFTINDLALSVSNLVGHPEPVVEYRKLPTDDPRIRQPDITKAKELLGWEPRVNLSEGLKLTIADFRNRLSQTVEIIHQKEAQLLH